MKPVTLTIAGSDSGAGAGIQADLKTFAALGCYGTSAITAVTAQNTLGVDSIETLTPQIVYAQIRSVAQDFMVTAAKTGMLATPEIIEAVVRGARDFAITQLVVDTVMVSKSGHRLLSQDAEASLIKQLLPCALIVTPNLPEAEAILDSSIKDPESMKRAAADLYLLGPKYVYLKGGHLENQKAIDIFYDGDEFVVLECERLNTMSTHGTGCTLSAAITAYLALGFSAHDACAKAKQYLTEALRNAEPMGHGHGPVNHFWKINSLSENHT